MISRDYPSEPRPYEDECDWDEGPMRTASIATVCAGLAVVAICLGAWWAY